MKTVIRLDVTDEQRRSLACLLAGKEVKRLATRDEVASYVLGMMGGLHRATPLEAPTPEAAEVVRAQRSAMAPGEEREAERLRAEGKCDSYIRGWIAAGRMLRRGKM